MAGHALASHARAGRARRAHELGTLTRTAETDSGDGKERRLRVHGEGEEKGDGEDAHSGWLGEDEAAGDEEGDGAALITACGRK